MDVVSGIKLGVYMFEIVDMLCNGLAAVLGFLIARCVYPCSREIPLLQQFDVLTWQTITDYTCV